MTTASRYALSYIERLRGLLTSVEVTTADASLMFESGIEKTVGIFESARDARAKLMFIGNGASASIASHNATDFLKAVGMSALCFNDGALLTCLGNDLGYDHTFDTPLASLGRPGDIAVCISSSGRSKNILNGAEKARAVGCTVVTFSGFAPDNPLRALGDVNFYVKSSGYGHVEILHTAILHCISDFMAGR